MSVHLVWQKLWCWALRANFSTKQFQTCPAYRYHWLLPFYTASNDLLGWGSQSQCKSKTCGLQFLHTFQLNGKKSGVVIIQVEHLSITFEWDFCNQGKQMLFYWLRKKSSTVACIQMFMNWFGSNLVSWDVVLTLHFDTLWPWPWFKVTVIQESKNFCTNVEMYLDVYEKILFKKKAWWADRYF